MGHDLPIHLTIGPASESDFTLSLKGLDRLLKTLQENHMDVSIFAAGYDAGHDGLGNYGYLKQKAIHPVIALNPRKNQRPKLTGSAKKLDKMGNPLCKAGIPMKRHAKLHNDYVTFRCPVKHPTSVDGKHTWIADVDKCPLGALCQPETKMGPVNYVNADLEPRYYTQIPRDSKRFKQIMKLRTGTERSNSAKKTTYKLERRVCRNDSHFLFRLYIISLIEHAKAWMLQDRKKMGNDWEKLVDLAINPPTAIAV